jgi:FtsP/CotA-like multicopper oxidase with cupredoxin domain
VPQNGQLREIPQKVQKLAAHRSLASGMSAEPGRQLLVAFNQPATREHPFMYHCHILEHEDAGMMGQYVCA